MTMRLKKRWITTVLREAKSQNTQLPFQRGQRRHLSIVRRADTETPRQTARG
ncbi:MAG: hypothetical protein AAFO80_15310 [Pseudomonadota bacterium]